MSYFIHDTSRVDEGATIGNGTKIWHFSHIQSDAYIGENCSLGQNVNVANHVYIGNGVKIQNNVSIYQGVYLDDFVFCGPSVVFTNDLNPRSKYPKGSEKYKTTHVGYGASLGANATILSGLRIGKWAMIGAGAVVTNDIPNYALMVGVPARQVGWVCECGEKLNRDKHCNSCKAVYKLQGKELEKEKEKEKEKEQEKEKEKELEQNLEDKYEVEYDRIQFRDLSKQYMENKDKLEKAITRVIEKSTFIGGEEVRELEDRLQKYIGVKHCITCANGTDALNLVMMAWNIKEGDAVFVADFTFFASGEVIEYNRATPIFVDVEQETFNIDSKRLEEAIISVLEEGKLNPRAIVTVDLFGLPANYKVILDIAKKYDLLVLEDFAQGFGGSIDGVMAGSFADVSTTSFFPAKPLGCYGDGGAIFTNNDELAHLIRSLKEHGKGIDKYDNVRIGLNSRLDTMQASILMVKLECFQEYELEAVNKNAILYNSLLQDIVYTPKIPMGYRSSFAQYTIQFEEEKLRDYVQSNLLKLGISSNIYYRRALHQQPIFMKYNIENTVCPISTKLCKTVLSLPMHPYLTKKEITSICEEIRQIMKNYKK